MNNFLDLLKKIIKRKNNVFNFPNQKISVNGYQFLCILKNLNYYFAKLNNLKKGSHVAIIYPNSIEYVAVSFFVILNKLVLVPINPEFKSQEVKKIYIESKSKFLIAPSYKSDLKKKNKEYNIL